MVSVSTITTIEETFTTTCGCYDCLACGVLITSDEGQPKCEECGLEAVSADYCSEACYDYKHENWESDLLPNWLKLVKEPDHVLIKGRAMGWQRKEGWITVEAQWDSIYRALTINGDYTLKITLKGENFTVVRYSHDEPTGATFTIEPTIVFEEH